MEGWATSTLGDSCTVTAGQSPKGSYYNDTGDGLPFYQGKKEFQDKFIGPPEKWTTQVTREAQAGDILMSVRAPVGPINFATDQICIGRGLAGIRAGKQLNNEFLFYALLEMQDQIKGSEGAVFASINKKQIQSLLIPLPPLSEQERIVAILDEAFAAIATATANAEKNLANARELFESYLNHVLSDGEDKWETKKLENVCKILRGSSPRPIKQFLTNSDDGVNWIKIADATGSEKYITSTKQKITREGSTRSRKVSPGDLILTNSMSFGKAFVMSIEGYIHDGWFVLRDFEDTFDLDFFFTLLKSKYVLNQINNLAAGSVVKNISSDLVKRIQLAVPPKEEQLLIISEANKRLDQTKELEMIYQAKIEYANNLKQSLLHKAFTGELTADKKAADRTLSEAGA